KHGREESWNAKEKGGAVPLKDLEHRLRGGPARIQDRLRADAHREIHVVAETIREKQLRRRERPIPLRDAEHLQPVGVRTHDHVVMEMDGPFRKSRRARRVSQKATSSLEVSAGSRLREAFDTHDSN